MTILFESQLWIHHVDIPTDQSHESLRLVLFISLIVCKCGHKDNK